MEDKISFGKWLQKEMIQRGWRPADLVQASELESAVISNLMSDKRNAGVTTCRAIAKAFKLPLTEVYQAAGLLDEDPSRDKTIDAISHLLLDLESNDKREVLEYVRLKHKLAAEKTDNKSSRKRSARGVAPT